MLKFLELIIDGRDDGGRAWDVETLDQLSIRKETEVSEYSSDVNMRRSAYLLDFYNTPGSLRRRCGSVAVVHGAPFTSWYLVRPSK
jgi:hypothetical protein